MIYRNPIRRRLCLSMIFACAIAGRALAADPVTLTVHVDQPGAKIDPIFYGLMTEEINHSYDGGLYGELIQNRIFQDMPARGGRRGGAPPAGGEIPSQGNLVHWSLVNSDGAAGTIAIDTDNPVNTTALGHSLRLDITTVAAGQRVGVANSGYWGIPVKPNTEYHASFFARASEGFTGPLSVAIEPNDGKTAYATVEVPSVTSAWKKYTITLKTGQLQPTAEARFVISAAKPGTVWLSFVSLFPPTYQNRVNGNRIDLSQLLADMKPAFLRFPGGNYVEGSRFEDRFAWKTTVGPLEERPGHNGPWSYRSSDGMGLLEFLGWCEDLKMEPVLAIYAGLHLDGGRSVITGDALTPYVQEAVDELEYITGDASTESGAKRAKDGHPQPFKLRFVEVGNEDNLNNGTSSYDDRFTMFYDAIKAKYPNMMMISTVPSSNRTIARTRRPDLIDDHFYMSILQSLTSVHRYDNYDRNAPKIFVGEWATRVGDPTPTMGAAYADAAWLTMLERNADVIMMNCYAPLFVNVNPGGQQWPTDLIGFNALSSYGSPSYYVQKMFSNNRGDVVLPAKLDPLPTMEMQLPPAPGRGRRGGSTAPATAPTSVSVDAVCFNATRDNATGDVILKLVNVQPGAQMIHFDIQGAPQVTKNAVIQVLAGDPNAVNTIAEPMKVAPKQTDLTNAAAKFDYELPAHSVIVMRLKTK